LDELRGAVDRLDLNLHPMDARRGR
jgi:hypothetical protein